MVQATRRGVKTENVRDTQTNNKTLIALIHEALTIALKTDFPNYTANLNTIPDDLRNVCKSIQEYGCSRDTATTSFKATLLSLANPKHSAYWVQNLKSNADTSAPPSKRRLLESDGKTSVVASDDNESNDIPQMLAKLLIVSLLCAEILTDNATTNTVDHLLCFTLVEDALDLISVDHATLLLGFLESNAKLLTKGINIQGGFLTLLRLCNEFIRRLSKTRHTVTSGRLLLFVASMFDLHERSGVNLKGDFNISNETLFEPYTDVKEPKVDKNTNQRGPVIKASTIYIPSVVLYPLNLSKLFRSEGQDTVRLLYNRFWTLHRYLNNPLRILDSKAVTHYQVGLDTPVAEFDLFMNLLDTVLDAFEHMSKITKSAHSSNAPISEDTFSGTNSTRPKSATDTVSKFLNIVPGDQSSAEDSDSMADDGNGSSKVSFFPKYLTNKSLFELQLRDPAFRRQTCQQIVITVQFILQESSGFQANVAAVAKKMNSGTVNKAVIQQLGNFTLTSIQEKALRQVLLRCDTVIGNILPDPTTFSRAVSITSFYEHNWETWKYYACPNFSVDIDESAKTDISTLSEEISSTGFAATNIADTSDDTTAIDAKRYFDMSLVKDVSVTVPKAFQNSEFMGNSNISEVWEQTNKIETELKTERDFRMSRSRWGKRLNI